MFEKQLKLSGFFEWQETEMIESENGCSVVFYYRIEKQENNFIMKIIINQSVELSFKKNIEITKTVNSIECIYKSLDALKKLVDTLNQSV